jgi:hypothetical protein
MVDVKVNLVYGSYHEVDSSEMAFKIAGSIAFKEAARKANPALLEPVMKVEVVTPEEYMGSVTGDLSSRRGRIEGMHSRPGTQIITCDGATGRNVWLRNRPTFNDAGTRRFDDALRALRGSAEERERRSDRKSSRRRPLRFPLAGGRPASSFVDFPKLIF